MVTAHTSLRFFPDYHVFSKKNSRQPFLLENIKPAFAGEPKQHGGDKNGHDAQNDKIPVFPMKLRHVIEIHAVNPAMNVSGIKMVETMVNVIIMAFIRFEFSVT